MAASVRALPPTSITPVSLPRFSTRSVWLASSRVPLPLTPYSDATPSPLPCASCSSRTSASVCFSGVPAGSFTVISKRSCASCGIRSAPSIGTSAMVATKMIVATPSTLPGWANALGSRRR
ncbi:hypothetical protein G6F68_019456 [Rhizopus microsporus]|nr:hypothetical protein G6F68_019456 [Rhizopus microsporus]